MTLDKLLELGFDLSEREDGGLVMVRCSRCAAVCINGVPTHETGCPNQMHECEECGTLVPKRQRLCESCANPDPEFDLPMVERLETASRDELQQYLESRGYGVYDHEDTEDLRKAAIDDVRQP